MPYRLENLLKTYLHLENYPVRVADMLGLLSSREVEYRLRRGPNFLVRPKTSDGSCVVDVTRENEYFPYFGIQPGDNIIDIGANIGSFSVYAAWLQPTAKVIAVEPLQDNFSLLKRNVDRNSLSNVECLKMGVMEKAGSITVFHGTENAQASSSVIASGVVDASRSEIVPCIGFTELLDKVPHCDFLKVDCEGAEFDFIPTAPTGFLRKKVRKIAMEYHDVRKDMNHKDLVKKLESEGFRVFLDLPAPGKDVGMLFAVAA